MTKRRVTYIHGPVACGKTRLANILAHEADLNLRSPVQLIDGFESRGAIRVPSWLRPKTVIVCSLNPPNNRQLLQIDHVINLTPGKRR